MGRIGVVEPVNPGEPEDLVKVPGPLRDRSPTSRLNAATDRFASNIVSFNARPVVRNTLTNSMAFPCAPAGVAINKQPGCQRFLIRFKLSHNCNNDNYLRDIGNIRLDVLLMVLWRFLTTGIESIQAPRTPASVDLNGFEPIN